MRADRLLAMLLILQDSGRMAAQTLAQELEVSVRTIYRDVEALSMAGVPLYTERGPGGGIALLGSYRTNLTGLSEDELRALHLLNIPTPLAELGISQKIQSALLKLQAALPDAYRRDALGTRQRLHLDWVSWHQSEESVPHLRALQEATVQNHMVVIKVRSTVRDQIIEHTIAPYSLVAKAGTWYLVGSIAGHKRVYRVSRIVDVTQLTEQFERTPSFNLRSFWQNWCEKYEERRNYFPVIVRIDPQGIPYLNYFLGDQLKESVKQAQPPDKDGWLTVALTFESFEVARSNILSCGRSVEILEPRALRVSVIDYAEQIITLYSRVP